LFRRGYKKNLKQLYIIEPTFFIKSLFKCFQPFVSSKFWKKLVYIEKLQDIYSHMSPAQFKLPSDVTHSLLPATTTAPEPEVRHPLHLFGTPLDVVMAYPMNYDSEIPVIVSDSLEVIEKQGTDVQGLFRLSGSRGRVLQVIQLYNSGTRVEIYKEDIHDITGVFKQYIRELPDPLFCYHLYQEWLTAYDEDCTPDTVTNLKALLAKLPLINWKILNRLFSLLHTISQKAEETKMNASNLAIVWTPNLLKSPNESLHAALMETPLTNQIVATIIAHYPVMFDSK